MPRIPLCSLVLQYSLNTSSVTNGTTPFGEGLAVLNHSFPCSSVSTMSPSNVPLCSHALWLSVKSATKLTVTDCVATGCSSFKYYTAILGEELYTGLIGFVWWSSLLSFTEAHGGLINYDNKLRAAENPILISIGMHDKCVASGTVHTAT